MRRIPLAATINDLSGFGRCSLTTAIPVLSVLGVQCCPVPTALLSCHTGFEDFFFEDLTSTIPPYLSNWHRMGLEFDAIYSGFLGSHQQILLIENFIKAQNNSPLCIVDTVMGDHGKIYSTYTEQMCVEMKKLASIADVITPNITEACYLTESPYCGENISISTAAELARKLCFLGAKSVVITGIEKENSLVNLVYEKDTAVAVDIEKVKTVFSGTGDLFASTLTGLLLNQKNLSDAVSIASHFIFDCLASTVAAKTPISEGVQFEPLLIKLGGKFYENNNE